MKLMTFNTRHCKSYLGQEIDFELMADAIKQCLPDIVASDHRPHTAEAL